MPISKSKPRVTTRMIDVRITEYVCPLSEQPQASLTPTIRVSSYADEDTRITGLIRIYRDSTGTMIYFSDLRVTDLPHGQTVDIEALTPFDPPEPADDDYFIKADITATSYLPGPPLHASLGAWHFDIKTPPMGETPAGHHVTHEDGGSDPVNVEDLPTTEMDDSLVLMPDGAGGLHFGAAPGGVTDHGALTGLADDDHPQYKLRNEVYRECDFLYFLVYHLDPWTIQAISGGTIATLSGSALHPGIGQLISSTSANSGYFVLIGRTSFTLAGGERSTCWHRPQTLTNTTRHHGFHDANSVSLPTEGAWIWQDPTTGIIYGRTRNSAGGSTTGTGFQLVTNTWYREKIVVNADATQVDFYCYAEDGTELWHDFLTTNIPTAVGEEIGHGLVATNSGTTAVALDDLDFLSLLIPNRRP